MESARPRGASNSEGRRSTSEDRWIGVISPFLGGAYFCRVMAGIKAFARERGFRVLVVQAVPRDVCRFELARDRVVGWIAIVNVDGIDGILQDGLPVVAMSAHAPDAACPNVLPDNRAGALAATRHLIGHGHKRIAFVGNMSQEDVRQRCQAYREGLEEGGIPLDPALVLDVADNERVSGRDGVRRLFSEPRATSGHARAECTAVFFGTDQGAFGAIDLLHTLGRRIPEDVAVVGFDDVPMARYASPPLATVRQLFDELGSTAARLLLDQIDGREVAPIVHRVPTLFVPRRSCGCSPEAARTGSAPSPAARDGAWESALASEIVALVSSSAPASQASRPEAIWPGVVCLIDGLRAAAAGTAEPSDAAVEQAWREAVDLAPYIDTLLAVEDRVEAAGKALGARAREGDSGGAAAAARVDAFVRRARRAMMRSRLAVDAERIAHLEGLLDANHDISTVLVKSAHNTATKLGWLRDADIGWGCLGLWQEQPPTARSGLRLVELYDGGDATPSPEIVVPAASFPPSDLLPASARLHGDDGDDVLRLLLLGTGDRARGIMATYGPVNHPLTLDRRDMDRWAIMLETAVERALLVESMTEQQRLMRVAYERERALVDVVRKLGCPVIPLLRGVLLVPLIGEIGPDRARQVLEAVLAGVSAHQAEVVLLDLTGVLLVDADVVRSLIQTAGAARLLGARVVVAGMQPQIAESIVGLGLDLGHIAAYQTLGAALRSLQRSGHAGG